MPSADASYSHPEDVWSYLDRLVATSQIIIDRPRGTAHPRFPEVIYPLDYGYLEGTTTVDGAGIDLWRGSDPLGKLDAVALTVDLMKRDAEIKLFLGCNAEEKRITLEFLNRGPMRATLVPRQMPAPLNAQVLDALLQTRRSVRRYTDTPVERGKLEAIVQMAAQAPSAHHRQPWRFAAIASPAVKSRLAEAMGDAFRKDLQADGLPAETIDRQVARSRQRIEQAPAAILVALDCEAVSPFRDSKKSQLEYIMAVQGVAMAGENLLLAAHAFGLGAVWMCAPLFAGEVVRQALGLPPNWEPQGLVLMGFPTDNLQERPPAYTGEMLRFIDE